VPDRATAIFMALFYDHLTQAGSYETALRQTKRDIIGARLPGVGPKTWLAFVLIEN